MKIPNFLHFFLIAVSLFFSNGAFSDENENAPRFHRGAATNPSGRRGVPLVAPNEETVKSLIPLLDGTVQERQKATHQLSGLGPGVMLSPAFLEALENGAPNIRDRAEGIAKLHYSQFASDAKEFVECASELWTSPTQHAMSDAVLGNFKSVTDADALAKMKELKSQAQRFEDHIVKAKEGATESLTKEGEVLRSKAKELGQLFAKKAEDLGFKAELGDEMHGYAGGAAGNFYVPRGYKVMLTKGGKTFELGVWSHSPQVSVATVFPVYVESCLAKQNMPLRFLIPPHYSKGEKFNFVGKQIATWDFETRKFERGYRLGENEDFPHGSDGGDIRRRVIEFLFEGYPYPFYRWAQDAEKRK